MKKIFLLLFLALSLEAATLQKHYLFDSPIITVESLLKESNNITEILRIPKDSTHYKISSKKLIALLSKKGINVQKARFSYVVFDKKSPVSLDSLKTEVTKYYQSHLPSIEINHVEIYPRTYIDTLPSHYNVHIGSKNFKTPTSTFYIIGDNKKRIFFNYTIKASLHVIKTLHPLERSSSLNTFNTQKTSITFNKIRSKPLLHVKNNTYALRHRVKENEVLFMRDVKAQDIVKKGAQVLLIITQGDLELQSSATAVTSGVLYDMITVQKKDGSRLKVKVIGVNQVEIQ